MQLRRGSFLAMLDALMTGICYCEKNTEYNLKLSGQILKLEKKQIYVVCINKMTLNLI